LCEAEDIAAAIDRATDADFRRALNGMANPYGDGHAAERISDRLADCALDSRLIAKKFYDIPVA
jgi:UDP-N-acetylglucosamine 2-epimerase